METLAQPASFDGGQKIRLLHGEVGGYVKDIVHKFLTTLPDRLVALSDALTTGDLRTLQSEAHKLKGAAATLGADHIVQLCCQLERHCQTGQLPATHLLVALHADAASATEEMNTLLQNLLPDDADVCDILTTE